MKIVIIKNHHAVLNAPKGWTPSRDGECAALPVRFSEYNGHMMLLSFWKPDAEELKALNEGASVCLGVVGTRHPPVCMMVQHVEEENLPEGLLP